MKTENEQIQEMFDHVDELFGLSKINEVERYLQEILQEAISLQEYGLQLAIYNEMMGYYRSLSRHDLSTHYAYKAITLLAKLDLVHDLQGATTLLNSATAYKEAYRLEEAKVLYERCLVIYNQELNESDLRFLSFYNNYSDFCLKTGKVHLALNYLIKALKLLNDQTNPIEYATTLTNLSSILFYQCHFKLSVAYLLKKAENLFTKGNGHSGYLYLILADLLKNQASYEKALWIIKKNYGKNDLFYECLDHYEQWLMTTNQKELKILVKKEKNKEIITGKELDYVYYLTYGKNLIEQKYSIYKDQMAIGLFGEGSECMGFDDKLSQDHDFYPRFCIFIPKSIYQKIGFVLEQDYQSLPTYLLGYSKEENPYRPKREGVFCNEDYFSTYFGNHYLLENVLDWFYMNEEDLALIQNGFYFENTKSEFKQLQQQLHYYPEDVRIKKIMTTLTKISKLGQYNYLRSKQRKDEVTAKRIKMMCVDEMIHLIYLLEKKYQPYYKWSWTYLKKVSIYKHLIKKIEELAMLEEKTQDVYDPLQDPTAILIELIAKEIIEILKKERLTDQEDTFLQNHCNELRNKIKNSTIKQMHIMEG